ncbi:MAG TPA: hypothetical protein QF564_13645 [Pirellulaceae bacterium]|nr:hypothetical protein [Pirellulaceae bacterium]
MKFISTFIVATISLFIVIVATISLFIVQQQAASDTSIVIDGQTMSFQSLEDGEATFLAMTRLKG